MSKRIYEQTVLPHTLRSTHFIFDPDKTQHLEEFWIADAYSLIFSVMLTILSLLPLPLVDGSPS